MFGLPEEKGTFPLGVLCPKYIPDPGNVPEHLPECPPLACFLTGHAGAAEQQKVRTYYESISARRPYPLRAYLHTYCVQVMSMYVCMYV
jgi:hypothetical protein